LYPCIAGRRTEKIVADARSIERRRLIFKLVSLILLAVGIFFTIF